MLMAGMLPPEDRGSLSLSQPLKQPLTSFHASRTVFSVQEEYIPGRHEQEHRIVYLVREDRIDFLQARFHY